MNTGQAKALPLTKSWVKEHAHLLEYGSDLFAEPIAEWLGLNVESEAFRFAFIEITRALEKRQPHGIFLNAVGFRERTGRPGWRILRANEMEDEARKRDSASIRGLVRTHITLESVPRELLNKEEARKLERRLQIETMRLLFIKSPRKMLRQGQPPPKQLPDSPQA